MHRLFDGPPRGIIQLILSVLAAIFYFFYYRGRFRRHPTIYEKFQSGSPDDISVLFAGFLLIAIGFSIAIFIVDFKKTGRWW